MKIRQIEYIIWTFYYFQCPSEGVISTMLHTNFKITLLFTTIIYLLTCTRNGSISGTIDETGTGKPTAAVIGLVVYENDMPVVGANVNLYSSSSVKKMVAPLKKQTTSILARNTRTNVNGFFRIDSVDTGRYYLEINDHDTLGALVETGVKPGDTIVEVDAILKRLGAIEGVIDSSLISKTEKTYVYIKELQRYIAVDTSGRFKIENVPSYNYSLIIIHDTVIIHSSLDTVKVSVTEGDTSFIGNRPPITLFYTDTNASLVPCKAQFLFKAEDPDSDRLFLLVNFGDGSVDTLHTTSGHVNHTYTDTGKFFIRFIADDKNGGFSSDSLYIIVKQNSLPVVHLTTKSVSGVVPFSSSLNYVITDHDNDSVDVQIDFGDGLLETAKAYSGNCIHIYQKHGVYKAFIIVKDCHGGIAKDSVVITVLPQIPPGTELQNPLNGATGTLHEIVLTWSAAANVRAYHLQVSRDSLFRTVFMYDSSVTGTSAGISNLENGSTFFWRVRTLNDDTCSSWSVPYRFTVIIEVPGTPLQIAPVNGATDIPVQVILSWSSVDKTIKYDIQIAIDSTFKSGVTEDSAVTSVSKSITGLQSNRKYYWRVRALNQCGAGGWSVARSFITILSTPQKTVLSTPSDFSSNVSTTVTFSWISVPDAYTYHFQLSTEPTFEHLDVEYLSLATTTKIISNLQKGTGYYWRVQATNASGPGEWSDAGKFTTVAEAPTVPGLDYPINQTTGIRDTVALSWHAALRATSYRVEVATDSTFKNVISIDSALTIVYKTISGLPKDTICYWRVKAANAGGESGWSETRLFYTKRVGTRIDLKQLSNWTIVTGTSSNIGDRLVIGDEIAQGDKIESLNTFVQPFTFVWWGSYPSTTLSYHTMNVYDSLETTAFSFWTRYQNPGRLGYTITIDGSYENIMISGIPAFENGIRSEFRTVCEDDSVSYFVKGNLIAKRAFPIHRQMRISFACYEHPFVIDSIYVIQY